MGKNNNQQPVKQFQRYGIRKFSQGVASVMIASGLFFLGSGAVLANEAASTKPETPAPKQKVVRQELPQTGTGQEVAIFGAAASAILVKSTLTEIANALEKEAGGLQAARVGNKTPVRLERHDPNIVRGWNNAKKGLYGELISDEYMVNKGFNNLLPDNRRVRSLEDAPKGRGIDGIYGNPNPPPPYIVTETKFRTAVGEYVDSDGTLTRAKNVEGLLGNTKDGKQMSNRWIKNRLEKEIGDAQARKVEQSYESWLMIVGPDGKVETIYKLDQNAKVVGTVKI